MKQKSIERMIEILSMSIERKMVEQKSLTNAISALEVTLSKMASALSQEQDFISNNHEFIDSYNKFSEESLSKQRLVINEIREKAIALAMVKEEMVPLHQEKEKYKLMLENMQAVRHKKELRKEQRMIDYLNIVRLNNTRASED